MHEWSRPPAAGRLLRNGPARREGPAIPPERLPSAGGVVGFGGAIPERGLVGLAAGLPVTFAGVTLLGVGAIRDDMVNAGVDWVDEATVVDGNLISARTPADLGPWMKALLAALAGPDGRTARDE